MKKLLLLLLIAASAEAADQKILIPIFYNGPGAGVSWTSALIINNKMSQPFRSPGVSFGIQCFIPEGCIADAVPSGQLGALALNRAPGGLLLTAPAEEADKLVLRLEIGATPRNPILVAGTAIPIVRERDFRTSTITLPYVAMGNGNRARIRIYDPESNDGAQVRVSIRTWSSPTGDPLDSRILTLHVTQIVGTSIPTPAYAEFDIAQMFPAAALQAFNFNVDVDPVTPGLRFWAFATVTTAANDVTAIWPQ
ncbi:MAG TPA: hypothetical protein VJ032_09295 [Thermoanaerobaculia bacterium]|nr:hypothetical protein [Thermoanaerobaculia bacterium]